MNYERERDFQREVINVAKTLGWRVAHFDASVRVVGKSRRIVGDTGSAGFPDLVLVRRDRLVFAELKLDRTKPTAGQEEWLADLARVSETYLWRPQDWNQIEETLK